MCERDVSSAYPSGISSTGSSPVDALFANRSATSLPMAPLWAGTHRSVTLFSLVMMREQASIVAAAKRFPGPRESFLTLVMAEVEST